MNSELPAKFTYHRIGVGGLCLKDNKILLVKHKYGPSKGRWLIPGGFVDLGESISEAIEREILEETSVSVQTKNLVAVRHMSRDRQSGGLVSDLYLVFQVEYKSGVPKASDDLEIEDTKFFPLEDLDEIDVASFSIALINDVLGNTGFNLLSYKPQTSTKTKLQIHFYELYG